MAAVLGVQDGRGETRDRGKDKGPISNTVLTTQNAVIKAFVCPSLETEHSSFLLEENMPKGIHLPKQAL